MVPSAELRLYQPLHAFPRQEQSGWERWTAPAEERPRYREIHTAQGLGLLVGARDGGKVLFDRGVTYLSPDRSEMQGLAALIALREVPPFESGFVGAAQARGARRALRRLRRRHPDRTPFVMTSAWSVPPRWFLLFDDDERSLQTEPELALRYRTTARKALERLERVIPLLQGIDFSSENLIDLYRWIGGVHPRSLLMLDYGGLAGLLRWDDLDDDHSARDHWEAIHALVARETQRSIELTAAIAARFAGLRARESYN